MATKLPRVSAKGLDAPVRPSGVPVWRVTLISFLFAVLVAVVLRESMLSFDIPPADFKARVDSIRVDTDSIFKVLDVLTQPNSDTIR